MAKKAVFKWIPQTETTNDFAFLVRGGWT